MGSFLEKLDAAAQRSQSLLCVGLDPDPRLMPVADIAAFTRAIIEATADLVCAYKPQIAFFEAQGIRGLRALEETLAAIPDNIPVVLDMKRGDVGSTARAYARAAFDVWGADATTVNPYLGSDSLEPFLEYAERGVFLLTRTSNPGSADLQTLEVETHHGRGPLYREVAYLANRLNERGNVGLVFGATHPNDLGELRAICPAMPILIPGVGPQGGDLPASVRNGVDSHGRRVMVNAARQVIYASAGSDFAKSARREAAALRSRIAEELQRQGLGW